IYLSERRLSERKSSSEKENPILLSPFIAITGHITNEEGQPLAGASVNIKGSDKGVATDEKGFFSIDCKKGDVLIISFLGYQSKEIKIENPTTLSIVLLHSDSKLD